MIYVSPYDTSYGKLVNLTKIKQDLVKFETLHRNENLNYEIPNGENYRIMFITGRDQDELDLPIWTQPIVFKSIDGVTTIATDMRNYVKKEIGINLLDVIKDKNNFDYLLLLTLLTGEFIDGNYGVFNNIIKNITLGFSTLISGIINSIVSLDPVEKVNVEIISNIYANLLFVPEPENDYIDGIVARCSKTRFSIAVNHKYITKLLELPGVNVTPKTYNDLINNIKAVLDAKSSLIDATVVLNAISNVWYGHGSSETVMISTEHMPTWISLLYTNLSNKSYRKTRLAMLLDKSKRNIKPDEIIKTIDLYLKDKGIEVN